MPARNTKIVLDEKWRGKIRTSMLINRLQNHVLGRIEMSATQLRAGEVLLRKCLPDLSATEISGAIGSNIARLPAVSASTDEWKAQWPQHKLKA